MSVPFPSLRRAWDRITAARRAVSEVVPPPGDIWTTDTGALVVGDGVTSLRDLSPAVTAAAVAATYLPRWKPNTAYLAAAIVVNPSGQIVRRKADGTSGATYDATAWDVVAGGTGGGGAVSSVAGRTGDVTLTKTDVGLGQVSNTADVDKPVSTAQAEALGQKVNAVSLAESQAAAKGYVDLNAGLQLVEPTAQAGEWVGPWNWNNSLFTPDEALVDFVALALHPGTYDAAKINVKGQAGSAGALLRVGIYSDASGSPGTLLAQTAALPATTIGRIVATLTAAIVVPAPGQLVWIGAVCQGGAATRPNIQRFTQGYGRLTSIAKDDPGDEEGAQMWGPRATGITGTFPAAITTARSGYNTQTAKVYLRRSA